jgi:hypothetical protein
MQEPGRRCVINGKVITVVKTEIECVHKGGDWMIFDSANTPTLSPDESKGTLPDNPLEINRANDFGNETMYR